MLDNVVPEIARMYNGKSEVANFFKALYKSLIITQFEPYRFFTEGDEVTVFINSKYMTLHDSKSYDLMLIHHFVIKENKIISFKEIQNRPRVGTLAKK